MKKLNIKELIARIKEKPSKFIYSALMVIFAAVFLYSTGFLVVYYIGSNKQAQQNDELASIVEQVQQEMNAGNNSSSNTGGNSNNTDSNVTFDPNNPLLNEDVLMEVTNPVTGDLTDVLREYSTIFLMNPDMVGWIKIPGSKVNYPVMQTPKDGSYYLKRDFYKQPARHGSIFAHKLADVSAPSDNVTLYGHNMADGSMFAGLHQYEEPQFYDEHPYIFFDSLTEHRIYKIIAVFYTTDLPDTGFAYHDYIEGDEDDFNRFIARCQELALYNTGDTATYGDKLLTLSTCDHDITDPHGRFVVVAKKVSL